MKVVLIMGSYFDVFVYEHLRHSLHICLSKHFIRKCAIFLPKLIFTVHQSYSSVMLCCAFPLCLICQNKFLVWICYDLCYRKYYTTRKYNQTTYLGDHRNKLSVDSVNLVSKVTITTDSKNPYLTGRGF